MDGVLVTAASCALAGGAHYTRPKCVVIEKLRLFDDFVRETGCRVVLSSSWRINQFEGIKTMFKELGASFELHDKTPSGSEMVGSLYIGRLRGNEIREWMDKHNVTSQNVVIFDDSDDMDDLLDRLVQTTWENGLETPHIETARRLLGFA
jgi:hypothetical protein